MFLLKFNNMSNIKETMRRQKGHSLRNESAHTDTLKSLVKRVILRLLSCRVQ